MKFIVLIAVAALFSPIAAQEAPTGSVADMKKNEKKKLEALKGTLTGKIAWASSRSNSKHDIWIMNADGTDAKQLTQGNYVDWYARFSPCGNKVLFARSKSGWVPEGEAEVFDKWDLWTINIDGTGEEKVADNGCWGTWRPGGDSIVFARGPKVFIKDLQSGEEKEIFDAGVSLKKGAYSQQPHLSQRCGACGLWRDRRSARADRRCHGAGLRRYGARAVGDHDPVRLHAELFRDRLSKLANAWTIGVVRLACFERLALICLTLSVVYWPNNTKVAI